MWKIDIDIWDKEINTGFTLEAETKEELDKLITLETKGYKDVSMGDYKEE
jgi:hypothetical protein